MATAQKISISLDQETFALLNDYLVKHQKPSRSHVISDALRALAQLEREKELAESYSLSAAADLLLCREFDGTTNDGLRDETW